MRSNGASLPAPPRCHTARAMFTVGEPGHLEPDDGAAVGRDHLVLPEARQLIAAVAIGHDRLVAANAGREGAGENDVVVGGDAGRDPLRRLRMRLNLN